MLSYYGTIYETSGTSPGVQHQFVPQNTEVAAKQALEEQKHGDEFKPQTSPDVQILTDKLNELEAEGSRICTKIYGPTNWYVSNSEPYQGPPHLEKERLHRRLNEIEDECSTIKAELRQHVEALGLNVETGSPYMGPH